MERVMKVQMSATLQNQSLARAIAAAYVSELDPTVDEMTEIKTAVSEAVSNAALHAYPDGVPGDMWLEFGQPGKDTVMVRVIDHGVGIPDIGRAMEPLFTTDPKEVCSGMGFTVMESFMDKIKVDSRPGEGTAVTMIKKLDTYYGD